jgi:hypothetical protein
MENKTQPRYYKARREFGNVIVEFEGEQYPGHPILDTRVSINGSTICWITWSNIDSFMQDLNVTEKYFI